MAVTKVTSSNFDDVVMKSNQPVLIDFFATWCGPCQMLSPVIDELSGEVNNTLFCKVNIDEESELAAKFGVSSIPTLALVKNGEVVKKSAGYREREGVIDFIEG